MKNLWAPWRITYVERSAEPLGEEETREPCVFCRHPKSAEDRENLLLFRGARAFVMLNRYPYANGHLLVVPYEHTADLTALPDDAHRDLFLLTTRMTGVLSRALSAEGMNIGLNLGRAAGAGIAEHLHVHIIPRWNGDTNFMPMLAEVKVISEHLLATYDRLLGAL